MRKTQFLYFETEAKNKCKSATTKLKKHTTKQNKNTQKQPIKFPAHWAGYFVTILNGDTPSSPI